MSILTIAWSVCGAASAMLALLQLLLWLHDTRRKAVLWSVAMAVSGSAIAFIELGLMQARSPDAYGALLIWANLAVFGLLVSLVWLVRQHFRAGRRWLAVLITLAWTVSLVVNLFSHHSVTFLEVVELHQAVTYWGEPFSLPVGPSHPWKLLPDLASLLIAGFILDASLQLWRRDQHRRGWLTGGSMLLFILIGGVHTPLVDAGLVTSPYMVSFAFLGVVMAMSYELVSESVRAEADLLRTRQQMERLGRANLLGELASTLAHELNQPLAAILANAQAARRFMRGPSPDLQEITEILEDIIRDDKRAGEVIRSLRAMLSDGVSRERFCVNQAIREVLGLMDGEMVAQGVRPQVELYGMELPVYAGRVEIQQVVMNLLSNALRAMSETASADRAVWVRTRLEGSLVRVDIDDSGTGVAPECLSRIFESFFAVRSEGLGLGLAICRRIVEACGGRIEAANRDGGGARFSFFLPHTESVE